MPVVADRLAQVPAGANLEAVGVVDGGHHPATHLAVQVLSRAVGRCGVLPWAAWPTHCMFNHVSNLPLGTSLATCDWRCVGTPSCKGFEAEVGVSEETLTTASESC